jgi:hypothetical protein
MQLSQSCAVPRRCGNILTPTSGINKPRILTVDGLESLKVINAKILVHTKKSIHSSNSISIIHSLSTSANRLYRYVSARRLEISDQMVNYISLKHGLLGYTGNLAL